MHEGRGYLYTFQRARVASSPEVPKVTWWKVATFLRLPFTLANFAWNFAKFQKNRTWHLAWYFSGEVSSIVIGVVARQLAPKCRDFSNVAKLASRCKWPLCEEKQSYCFLVSKLATLTSAIPGTQSPWPCWRSFKRSFSRTMVTWSPTTNPATGLHLDGLALVHENSKNRYKEFSVGSFWLTNNSRIKVYQVSHPLHH